MESTRVLDHLPVSFPRIGRPEGAVETEPAGGSGIAPAPVEPAQPAPVEPEIVARPETRQPAGTAPAASRPADPQLESRPAPPQSEPRPAAQGQSGQPVAGRPEAGENPGRSPQPSQPVAASRPVPPRTTVPESPPATREQAIYFARIDAGGTVIRTRIVRRLPVSDSPLMDSLRALLAGPSAEEERQGIRSLIPPGTRLLSGTTVRGSTAYVSFSEDFQYNTFGVEGYAAQLRQVIWTATEFPNIKDVQILIEGRRIDYLGESIGIGSPLSRESL